LICCHGKVRTKLPIDDDIIADDLFASKEFPPFKYLSYENEPPSPEYESLSPFEFVDLPFGNDPPPSPEYESLPPFEFVQAIELYDQIPTDDIFLSEESEDLPSIHYSFLPSSDSYFQDLIPTDDTFLI
jgi:hypothetical protein